MERSEVETKVKGVIARVLKINEAEISSDANFIFDLGADSMQSMQLVAAFEEEFDVEMEEDKALDVQSVAAAVDFIKSLVDERN
ncbi:MAG: acyl carrier protein [Spirochaetales bacterium]|nr:acyl carrier protein [Spirochaetales bacterium]